MSIRSLCVYCGASTGASPSYAAAADRLGQLVASHGIQLVYGGGKVGLMGILSEAALRHGGRVVGVIPGFLEEREVGHGGVTELIQVPDMHTRKRIMWERSDAFAVLPGGFGTLEEMFEMLTWKQLRLHQKPIFLIDLEGYWQPLLTLMDSIIQQGFAKPSGRDLLTVVRNVEELVPALAPAA